jgi:coenzyme F420 hydrogenase subunit delta
MQLLNSKRILIFGCGNPLFGDDGFGPAVIEHLLSHNPLPECTAALDAGTGIRDFLFDLLLSPIKPEEIYVVDAVSLSDRVPGELFELRLHNIPIPKATDFSLHQFPSVNLLAEINTLTRVTVLAVQAEHIPEFVQPGLSVKVRSAIEPACAWLLSRINSSIVIPRNEK